MGKTIISIDGRFEWDSDKNKQNIKKHGIDFDEILAVFDDPMFLEGYDQEHSENEDRFYGIGCIDGVLFILVFYTERNNRIRLISARLADTEDKKEYDEFFKKINT
jgi:uncharacterized DUF497 family protein